jgi:hypothetical protein
MPPKKTMVPGTAL